MRLHLLILFLLLIIGNAEAVENQPKITELSASATSTAKANNAPSQPEVKKTVNLETAYKREYAFLTAQKRELQKRLGQYRKKLRRDEQALSNKIKSLEKKSIDRSARIDQLGTQLADVERTEVAVEERSSVLEVTYSQAEATLKNHNINLPASLQEENAADQKKLGFMFNNALRLLGELGSVQTKAGTFFLANGKQVQGNIIQLGNISAFGISEKGSGSLVPAGGGDFKIWNTSEPDTAVALSENKQPDTLKLFLFESRTTAVEEAKEKTVLGVINSGGVIGWIIVALGGLALLLILVRAYLLRSNSADTARLSEQVLQHVASGNLNEANKQCTDNSSAITRVIKKTLNQLNRDQDHMESVVHEAMLNESGPLDRFGSVILVIASVSPLLGLLGTVTGMISTFDVITEFGTGDPKLLSGGISVALVTTELGLIVAIPALLLGSLLSAWARNIKRDMEHAALKITNTFFTNPTPEAEPKRVLHNDDSLVLQGQPA